MRIRIDGAARRARIVAWLRENPGASKVAIARGVGLHVNHRNCSTLDNHLSLLWARGEVRLVGRVWEAAL